MNGVNDPAIFWPLVTANIVALVILGCCWKFPRAGRLLMFALFVWAGCTNWYYATQSPNVYLDYANYTFLPFYRNFIQGWFSKNILATVGFIATCEFLISAAMLMKGAVLRLGIIGGMIFFLGILPLGAGSGFPFPVIGIISFYLLYKSNANDYLWKRSSMKPAVGV
jgi:hypothetical protein